MKIGTFTRGDAKVIVAMANFGRKSRWPVRFIPLDGSDESEDLYYDVRSAYYDYRWDIGSFNDYPGAIPRCCAEVKRFVEWGEKKGWEFSFEYQGPTPEDDIYDPRAIY